MARDTLPRGASLLALAGSSLGAHETEPEVVAPQVNPGPSPVSRIKAPAPRYEPIANAPPSIGTVETRKQKVNARISGALLEEVRDCAVALSGPPHGLTMDQFAEEAYRRELERLKRSHNSGQPFARRPYNPKSGRRVR